MAIASIKAVEPKETILVELVPSALAILIMSFVGSAQNSFCVETSNAISIFDVVSPVTTIVVAEEPSRLALLIARLETPCE